MNEKVLLYLASGNYQPDYETLPFKKIILVDRIPNSHSLPIETKVEYWQLEVVEALEKLQEEKIQIDAIVIMNEGLFEGGASYALFSDFIMGLIYTIVAQEFTLITSLSYYSAAMLKKVILKMDWGFEILNEIEPKAKDFISPKIFDTSFKSTHPKDYKFGEVFRVRKVYNRVSKRFKNIELNIIHGSIWSDINELNAFGFRFFKKTLKQSYPKTYKFSKAYLKRSRLKYIDLSDKTTQEILSIIENDKNIDVIGLCPWLSHDYEGLVDEIFSFKFSRPIKINFYHLNKNDFNNLYSCFGDYYYQKYISLFSDLKKNKEAWSRFELFLNSGAGHVLIPLCEILQNSNTRNNKTNGTFFKKIELNNNKVEITINKSNSFFKTDIDTTEKNIHQYLKFYDSNLRKSQRFVHDLIDG